MQRDKGARFEREVTTALSQIALGVAQRVPLSGAAGGSFKGDVLWHADGKHRPFIVECKHRADGFKQLYSWLDGVDLVCIRADRKERLYILPERVLKELL